MPKTFPKLESVDESIAQTLGLPSSWYTIPSGIATEYISHDEIVLKPGFHAQAGSDFKARIEPCTDCDSSPLHIMQLYDEKFNPANQNETNSNDKTLKLDNVMLGQNIPNPVNESCSISFYIHQSIKNAHIQISDISGIIVKNIPLYERGKGRVNVETTVFQEGIYIYSLIVDGRVTEVKKMIVL